MKNSSLLKITMSAMLAALICVATMFFMIPLPGHGYANMGDCFVIVAGMFLGPVYGGLAAAVGSALSDLFLGYAVYAPATFIIKGLMALAAYGVYIKLTNKNCKSIIAAIISAVIAEVIMIAGYFVFEIPLYGLSAAAVDVVGNAVQGIVGAISGTIVYEALSKVGALKKVLR